MKPGIQSPSQRPTDSFSFEFVHIHVVCATRSRPTTTSLMPAYFCNYILFLSCLKELCLLKVCVTQHTWSYSAHVSYPINHSSEALFWPACTVQWMFSGSCFFFFSYKFFFFCVFFFSSSFQSLRLFTNEPVINLERQ